MAPKKKPMNAFGMYMLETQQLLSNRGIKMSMADMPSHCKENWEKMPDHIKGQYKVKAKNALNGRKIDKYTNIGEKIEDVQRESENVKLLANAMYHYIEELVQMDPPFYFLPKQKFIFIFVNSYCCENESFHFPAEVTMVEFSLERGLIRIIHELLGFDKIKTSAPVAPTADINLHAKNNHHITTFTKLPINYKATFFKLISFIVEKEVDEDMFNDPSFDMPPIYTAHDTTGNDLSVTFSSLYQLYQSAVSSPLDKAVFGNIFKVYHLDKLFMEIKNKAYSLVNPDCKDKALPSVALASDSLTKDMLNAIKIIGCTFHDRLQQAHVCSNYFVCKWIYIFSTHCCHYLNIKLKPSFHYDFDLSYLEIPIVHDVRQNIEDLEISKSYVTSYEKQKKKDANKFPALGGKPTVVQQTTWGKPNKPAEPLVPNKKSNNFPPLSSSNKNALEHTSIVNSWGQSASREGETKVKPTKDKPPVSNNSSDFPPLG
ncbi:Hypothetical protein CINCED_3A011217 [Cinara cedri]|nr:Hypothetical protein CINCED_3A011217 [Cinara cedri]